MTHPQAGNVSKREAARIAKKIEVGIYPDDYVLPTAEPVSEAEAVTVRDAVDEWLDSHSKTLRSHKDNEYRANKHLFTSFTPMGAATIMPAIGEYPIAELTEAQCREYLAGLLRKPLGKGSGTGKRCQGDTLSPQTVNHVLKILRQSLAAAVPKHIATSPAAAIKPFRVPESDAHIEFVLTNEEIDRVLEIEDVMNRYICAVAIFTAERRGELFGQQWKDHDQSGRHDVLHVRRSYDAPTKGFRNRYVPVIPELDELLRDWKKLWPEQSGTGRLPTKNDFIFPVDGSNGKMRNRGSHYTIIDDLRSATGRSDLVMHDLRHTAATRMAQAGVNVHVIQKALGHSSIKITEKYIHTEDDLMAREMAKLSEKNRPKVVQMNERRGRKGRR